MTTGPNAELYRAVMRKARRPVPDNLFPPPVMSGWEPWLAAFWELGTDRQLGMATGPIPAASIDRHTAGWPRDDAAMFRRVMRALDGAYLDSLEARREAEGGK